MTVVSTIDLPPAPPKVARVLEGTSANANLEQARSLIDEDPALGSELLRVGNSTLFSETDPVYTTDRLLMRLGMRAFRGIVVSLGLRDCFRELPFDQSSVVWVDALRRAAIAWRLAKATERTEPMQALFAGLMVQVGTLAVIQQHPLIAPDVVRLQRLLPSERPDQEIALCGSTFNVLSAGLLRQWGMTADVIEAVTMFHSPNTPLNELLRLADLCAAVYTATDTRQALQLARQRMQSQIGMGQRDTDALLRRAPTDAQDAASAFGIRVGIQPAWQDLLSQAASDIDPSRMTPAALADQVARLTRDRDAVSFELQMALSRAERGLRFDPLTSLPNTPQFEESMLREMPRLSLPGYQLTLLMGNIENLGLINDRFGHAVGDQVLRGVADALNRSIRASDLRGRLCGGTVISALPACSPTDAQAVIARLRGRLASLQFGSDRSRFRPAISLCVMSLEGPVAFEDGRQGSYLRALLQRLQEGTARGRRKASDQTHWLKAESGWSLGEWWRKL
jgi:diguanylate cyclase (GGDEF)-like protein